MPGIDPGDSLSIRALVLSSGGPCFHCFQLVFLPIRIVTRSVRQMVCENAQWPWLVAYTTPLCSPTLSDSGISSWPAVWKAAPPPPPPGGSRLWERIVSCSALPGLCRVKLGLAGKAVLFDLLSLYAFCHAREVRGSRGP